MPLAPRSLVASALFAAALSTSLLAESAVPPKGGSKPRDGATPAVKIESVRQFDGQSLDLPAGIPDTFSFIVSLRGTTHLVHVTRLSLRDQEFAVYIDVGGGALVPVEPPPHRTYRGTVEGVEGSGVALSLIDGQVRGLIDLAGEGIFFIQPESDFLPGGEPRKHVTFAEADVIAPEGVSCGVGLFGLGLPDWMGGQAGPLEGGMGGVAGAQPQVVEIGFDADFEFFQKNSSSVTITINDIETVMNGVDFIYDRDVNIGYEFTSFIVRSTSDDPYTTLVMGDLLCEFRNTWNANPANGIQRDVAQLYTGKNVNGNVIGLAWLGVMCNQSGNDCGGFGNLAYSAVESRYNTNIGLRQSLSAHELGHNWNATHCDGNGDCHIMCSSNNGCNGVGGANLKFGAGEVAQIVAYRNIVGCDSTSPLPLSPPFNDTFPNTSIDSSKWTYNDGAATSTAATNEPSPTRSLNLNASGSGEFADDEIRTNQILLGALPTAQVAYWTQSIGVEAGETLIIEYWSSTGDWSLLNEIVSDGSNQSSFTQWIHTLPANGRHDGFRLRFRADVNESNDNWYIDDVTIAQSISPPPSNDECITAAIIGVGNTAFNTMGATDSFQSLPAGCDEGNGAIYKNDIWYLVQAPCTGLLTVTTCGTANFDTRIAIYSALNGCPLSGAATIACSDNFSGCSNGTSFLQFEATQNLPYYIRVGGAVGGGTGTLAINCTAAPQCTADLNGDGVVGGADLASLRAAWGTGAADVDNNGTTDAADLAIVLAAWGACP